MLKKRLYVPDQIILSYNKARIIDCQNDTDPSGRLKEPCSLPAYVIPADGVDPGTKKYPKRIINMYGTTTDTSRLAWIRINNSGFKIQYLTGQEIYDGYLKVRIWNAALEGEEGSPWLTVRLPLRNYLALTGDSNIKEGVFEGTFALAFPRDLESYRKEGDIVEAYPDFSPIVSQERITNQIKATQRPTFNWIPGHRYELRSGLEYLYIGPIQCASEWIDRRNSKRNGFTNIVSDGIEKGYIQNYPYIGHLGLVLSDHFKEIVEYYGNPHEISRILELFIHNNGEPIDWGPKKMSLEFFLKCPSAYDKGEYLIFDETWTSARDNVVRWLLKKVEEEQKFCRISKIRTSLGVTITGTGYLEKIPLLLSLQELGKSEIAPKDILDSWYSVVIGGRIEYILSCMKTKPQSVSEFWSFVNDSILASSLTPEFGWAWIFWHDILGYDLDKTIAEKL